MAQTLHDLFVHDLKDIYSAEHQVAQALPELIEAAISEELKAGLQQHLEQTREQISRLETISEQLDFDIHGETCTGMQGLIEEGKRILNEFTGSDVLDAAIIGAANKVEHYEIAAYGTVATYAQQMDHTGELELLEQSLTEEEEADAALSELAETKVNVQVPTGH